LYVGELPACALAAARFCEGGISSSLICLAMLLQLPKRTTLQLRAYMLEASQVTQARLWRRRWLLPCCQRGGDPSPSCRCPCSHRHPGP
jgi:hypothetical protein